VYRHCRHWLSICTLVASGYEIRIGPRREIAIRTIFNILGPLTNPAGAKRQILGIFDPKLTEKIACVLKDLNSEHVLVVHGEGLDEISPCGKTIVSELKMGNIKTYEIHPSDFNMALVSKECLSGGDAKANAQILINVLKGGKGPKRNAVVLNAGAAIYVSGKAGSLKEGIVLAEESIDSGAAFEKLERLKEFSNA
jgi:anthranilate phosphoribosyltransferase